MATRSTIAQLNKDGTITSIYCHWDGYPEGVGSVLDNHYNTDEMVDKLLNIGDISTLCENIDQTMKNSYRVTNNNPDLICDKITHTDLRDWLDFRKNNWCEYGYLWDGIIWNVYNIE
jgi:hypothetical protein